MDDPDKSIEHETKSISGLEVFIKENMKTDKPNETKVEYEHESAQRMVHETELISCQLESNTKTVKTEKPNVIKVESEHDPEQSIVHETESISGQLESNITNVVKTEKFNEIKVKAELDPEQCNTKHETKSISDEVDSNIINVVKREETNKIKIKSEHDWLCPNNAEQIEPNLSIVKSEYEFQPNFLNWTVDKEDNSDDEENKNEEDVESDNVSDGDDYDDNNDDKNPISLDSKNSDVKQKSTQSQRKENFTYFQRKRNFFETYLIRACPYCAIEFASVTAWGTHLNDIHKFRSIQKTHFTPSSGDKVSCKECETLLSSASVVLRTHVLIHLPYTNIYKCKLCTYARPKYSMLLTHIERKHFDIVGEGLSALMETKSFKNCPYCRKYVGISNMLTKHIQSVHSDVYEHKLYYVCPFCAEKFVQYKDHKEHLEHIHQFKSLAGLSFEMMVEQENNVSQIKYQCLKCNVFYAHKTYSSVLIFHALTHLPYKCFKCRFCEYEKISKSEVIRHICKNLLLDIKNNPMHTATTTNAEADANTTRSQFKQKQRRDLDEINKLYVCPKCGEDFEQQALWEVHLIKEHNFNKYEALNIETTASAEGQSKVTSCTICKKIFSKPTDFLIKLHAFKHMPYKIYKCKLCHASKSSLVACDCQDKLGKEKLSLITYVCPKCGMAFVREFNWKKHITTMHDMCTPNGLNFLKISNTETPNYKCSDCDVIIEESSSSGTDLLFKHASVVHMPFKCYDCSNCGERSDSLDTMIEHCNNCYNQTELNTTEDNRVADKTKNKAKTTRRRKRKLCTGDEMEFQFAENEIRMPRLRLFKNKNVVPETQAEHSEKNDKKHVSVTQSDSLEKNVQKSIKNSIAICSSKSFVLNKYSKFITYACPECNILLPTSTEWNTHITTEHDFFAVNRLNITAVPGTSSKRICNECHGTINGALQNAQLHKLKHMPYQGFICNICYHRTKSLNLLYAHIQKKHLTLGKFQCIFCGVFLSTFYERYEHIKSEHSDVELKNVCKICSKLFDSAEYKKHMRIHDINRKFFECTSCDRKYSRIRDLTIHLKQKHGTEFETGIEKTEEPELGDKNLQKLETQKTEIKIENDSSEGSFDSDSGSESKSSIKLVTKTEKL